MTLEHQTLLLLELKKNLLPPPLILDTGPSTDQTIMKTLIYCPEDQIWHFGSDAKTKYQEYGMKGRMFRSIKKFLPEKGFEGSRIHSNFFTIEEIISKFLSHLKKISENQLQSNVDKLVLGRPVRFSLNDKSDRLAQDRLESAAKIAGFKDIIFCPEPFGAAFEYKELNDSEKIVLIADFGGGTSDFTIIKMGKKEIESSDVIGMSGVFCAGDSFDSKIMRNDLSSFFGSKVEYTSLFNVMPFT